MKHTEREEEGDENRITLCYADVPASPEECGHHVLQSYTNKNKNSSEKKIKCIFSSLYSWIIFLKIHLFH